MGNQYAEHELMQKGTFQHKVFVVTMMVMLIFSTVVTYMMPTASASSGDASLSVTTSDNTDDAKTHINLKQYGEEFTYIVKAKVPSKGNTFVIEDKVVQEMNLIPQSAEINLEGLKAKVLNDDTVTVTLGESDIAKYAGETAILTFKAELKEGANLSAYLDEKVPNTAKTYLDGVSTNTNTVTVAPPSNDNHKLVDGQSHLDLPNRTTPFTYTIETTIPKGSKSFVVIDKLHEAVEVDGDVTTNLKSTKVEIENDKGEKEETTVEPPKPTLSKDGKTVRFELDATQIEAFKDTRLVVTIPAKISKDAELKADSKILEVATIEVDGKSTSTTYATVSVKDTDSKPSEPNEPNEDVESKDVIKTVNGEKEITLKSNKDEFTYEIRTVIPKDAKTFVLEDVLAKDLKIISTELNLRDVPVKVDGQTVKVELSEGKTNYFSGDEVILAIKAKLNDKFDPAKNKGEKVSNVASVILNENQKFSSNKAYVVPTTTEGEETEGEKKVNSLLVNGKEHAQLQSFEDTFEYTINVFVPKGAKSFVVSSELVKELEVLGLPSTNLKDVKATVKEDTVSLELDESQIKEFAERNVQIKFLANIKNNADLSKYKDGIPNVAKVQVDGKSAVETNIATVSVPHILKTVDGKNEISLKKNTDEFTYQIRTVIPKNAKSFVLEDVLVDDLKIISTELNLRDVPVKVDGQSVKVELSEEKAKYFGGDEVILAITAKLSDKFDATKNAGKKLPNVATVKTDANEKLSSNTVNVVPTATTSEDDKLPPVDSSAFKITKTVNGKDSLVLKNNGEKFVYELKTTVPKSGKFVIINDTLANDLEHLKSTTNLDGVEAKFDKQRVNVTLTEQQIEKYAGKELVVLIEARLKDNFDASKYKNNQIPNTATLQVDEHKAVDSNTVNVSPLTFVKTVNNSKEISISNISETFTYQVEVTVPTDVKSFVVSDELEDVLEFTDKKPTVNLQGIEPKIDGQKISVELNEEQVKKFANQKLVLTFGAKVHEKADLTKYSDSKVPNTALYQIDSEKALSSNTVYVSVKDVAGKDEEEKDSATTTPPSATVQPPTETETETVTVEKTETVETLPQTGNESTNAVLIALGLLLMSVATGFVYLIYRKHRNQIA